MQLLTTEEAAARCKLSARTLEKLRQTGEGPVYVRVAGEAVRYREDDLAEWIEKQPRHLSTSEYKETR